MSGPQADMEVENDIIAVAQQPPPSRRAQPRPRSVSPSYGSRIPETVVANYDEAQPGIIPQPQGRTYRPTNTISPIDHLRIRNALQREEVRATKREMKRTQEEVGQVRHQAATYRAQLEAYRNEVGEARRWMTISWFFALAGFFFVALYVVWCRINSTEFEYQNRILRRNLGLE